MKINKIIKTKEEFEDWWKTNVIQSEPFELPNDLDNFWIWLNVEFGMKRTEPEVVGWNGCERLVFLCDGSVLIVSDWIMSLKRTKKQIKKIKIPSDKEVKKIFEQKILNRKNHLLKLKNKNI